MSIIHEAEPAVCLREAFVEPFVCDAATVLLQISCVCHPLVLLPLRQ